MSEKSFTDSLAWPVIFMLIISFVFVGVLAAMYRSSESRIESHKKEQYERMILELAADSLSAASGRPRAELIGAYPQSFQEYITAMPKGRFPRQAYEVRSKDRLLAYVFDIGGKGLWGSMRALVALTPDLQTLICFAIYEQMETPGLGARITEDWFLGQFKARPVIDREGIVEFELIPEGQSPETDRQIRQVTGATITSVSVLKMLKEEISLIHAGKGDTR